MSKTILLGVLLSVASVAAAQTSQRISAGKANDYGLVYTLPNTVADVYLTAELVEETPGEFHNYARRYLGATDAITTPSRSARLTEATVFPRGEANPSEQWLAQFKNGSTPFMTLTPGNIPTGINTETLYHTPQPDVAAATEWTLSPLEGEIARQAVTAEMARSSSTSKRAELAAQRIFELREMRSDILSGQADNMPTDGTAMELVLNNLSAQEAALTAMFTGVRRTRTVTGKVTVVPDTVSVSDRVIARLSATDGIIDASNLSGSPITADITVIERGTLPTNDKGELKTFPRGGVAYCIPGKARIEVSSEGNTLTSQNIDVAQLGVVFGLNPALFTDKREPAMAVFDPTTGAIVELGPVR